MRYFFILAAATLLISCDNRTEDSKRWQQLGLDPNQRQTPAPAVPGISPAPVEAQQH